MKRNASQKANERISGAVGIGFDGDGHKRVTKTDDGFTLVGGSQETHERMQEVAVRAAESLEKRGKRLQDCSPQEAADIIREAQEKVR